MNMVIVGRAGIAVQTKLLTPTAKMPTYGTDHAAGMDLYVDILGDTGENSLDLQPGQWHMFKTGIAMALPCGYYGRISPRSGLALKNGLDVLAGTIDADYRGKINVILINFGTEPYTFNHGDRVAQMIITTYSYAELVEVDELDDTARGDGAYGSTGR